MKIASSFVILLNLVFSGCDEPDCSCVPPPKKTFLGGTWQLYELGYSPGWGYITEADCIRASADTKIFGRQNAIKYS